MCIGSEKYNRGQGQTTKLENMINIQTPSASHSPRHNRSRDTHRVIMSFRGLLLAPTSLALALAGLRILHRSACSRASTSTRRNGLRLPWYARPIYHSLPHSPASRLRHIRHWLRRRRGPVRALRCRRSELAAIVWARGKGIRLWRIRCWRRCG
jgi:hypothetical protein